MIKIGFVSTGTLRTFGTTYRVLGLSKYLSRQGYEPFLIVPNWRENLEIYSKSDFNFLKKAYCSPRLEVLSKYQTVLNVSPDVLHCLAISKRNLIPSLFYQASKKRPLLVDLDEDFRSVFRFPKNLYALLAESWAVKRADKVIVASKALYGKLIQKIETRKVVYLPRGVDLETFNRNKRDWQRLRDKWGSRVVLTYLGSFQPWYDADMVLKVAKLVVRKRNDVLFLMIGIGPMEGVFKSYVRDKNLGHFVKFTGYIPEEDVPKYLCASDVLLFPIRDNWLNQARCPGKIYLYLASGRPIVSNPVGEVKEALDGCAWFFDYTSLSDFAEKILLAIENGNRASSEMLREAITQNSWESRCQVYVKYIIEELL